jgi:hypothetical protein
MYLLTKLTEPSWEKIVMNLLDAKSTLVEYCCPECLDYAMDTYGEYEADDLLSTRCGEEFRLEEIDISTVKCEKVCVDDEGVMQVEMTCYPKEPINQIHITVKLDNIDEWSAPPNHDRSEL